jgi:CRISPR-associated endonuclease/helicase Cas3
MSDLDFVDYFTDVYEYAPFPWQERLAKKLVTDHAWPDLIDLPTASGKTACLDIALFHLAWCAERGEAWRAARRIVFVVDRRIIVDSAADRANKLREALENPRTTAVKRVARALDKLGGSSRLICEKLRGGMPRERGFALDPAQPMIITSTVDQVGSRLLFRGYGLSPYAYPIHAGLLGFDTLILVDEAHLSAPLLETVSAIRAHQARAERPFRFVQPVRVVPLSATAKTEGRPFQLTKRDLANKHLAARRTAAKPARLIEESAKPTERAQSLLRETIDLYLRLDVPAPAVVVIVNRVRTARVLYDSLLAENATRGCDIELMIGRSRSLDRDAVAERVMARAGAHVVGGRERGLIVVATQTIEVGADLDFQGLVTECAALDALRQRFGRLDRLGKFRKAKAVIVGSSETQDDPIYGLALGKTWSWLKTVARKSGGHRVVDFSIESVEKLTLGLDLSSMSSSPREMLTLTPVHIDLLSQTSPTPMYEPDVQALLHGLKSGTPDVQVVWRADLPMIRDDLLDASELRIAATLLELNPPNSLESLSLPLADVRAWLQGRVQETNLADLEGAPEHEPVSDIRTSRLVLRRSTERWEYANVSDIKLGDTIVVPSAYGGCDEFGFSPNYTKPVTDLSAAARKALKKSALVVITKKWLESLGMDTESLRSVWHELEENQNRQISPYESWLRLTDQISHLLTPEQQWLRARPVLDGVLRSTGELHGIIATEGAVRTGDMSDEDFTSSYTVPVSLDHHHAGVARQARRLAKSLSLEVEHVRHVTCAGGFHDIGKAHPRVQRSLRSGDDKTLSGQLLAKGLRRSSVGHVEFAERHEAYSVAFLKRYPELLKGTTDPELVQYLTGTHHGRGRALMPDRRDEGTVFKIEFEGRVHRFEGVPALGTLGSGWAALFWRMNRRYGPWGIAYLESILRLADWMRSAQEIEESKRQ